MSRDTEGSVTAKTRSAASVSLGDAAGSLVSEGYPLRKRGPTSVTKDDEKQGGTKKKHRQTQTDSENSSTSSADTLVQTSHSLRYSPRSMDSKNGVGGNNLRAGAGNGGTQCKSGPAAAHRNHASAFSTASKTRGASSSKSSSNRFASSQTQSPNNRAHQGRNTRSCDAMDTDPCSKKVPNGSSSRRDASSETLMSSSKTPFKE